MAQAERASGACGGAQGQRKASSCLGRQEAGEWMRLLDDVDCHIDCPSRLRVCQLNAAMRRGYVA